MGRAYQQVPIGITVEGANILTRSLIIFGQGAIRCHPYLLPEMQAAQNPDQKKGLVDFDKALFGHIGFTIKNGVRALWLGMTGSHFSAVNTDVAPEMKRYYQQLTRFSAAFAFLSDVSLLVLGGSVKRREKLSARLGDILSQMYLISCTLKRYEAEGRKQDDAALAHWAIWDAMYKAQQAFDGVIANFPVRFIAAVVNRLIFPWGHPYVVPSDEVGHQVAKALIAPSATRDRLTAECFVPLSENEPVGAIELALQATLEAEPIEAKIRAAEKAGRFDGNPRANVRDIAIVAAEEGVITPAEFAIMKRRNHLRDIVVQVDDFPFDYGVATANKPADNRMAA
jgi:acyl-CoA dehydrogenase